MAKVILGNLAILALAFLYWFLVDYLYALGYEFYHPYEWVIQGSFVVFVLISFAYTRRVSTGLPSGTRRMAVVAFPMTLVLIFLGVLAKLAVDFHLWVGLFLYP